MTKIVVSREKQNVQKSLGSRFRGNDEVFGKVVKIETILTPTLSLKEREKCSALQKSKHFRVTEFPPTRE
jgi:hypothetical protein